MTKDEALKKAFKQAFQLGQDYWYQADHEFESQNKKSDVTRAKFEQLMEDAIKEALAQPEQEPVTWGVDWGRAGQAPCVSIIKRLSDGRIEVVAVEYGPQRTWVNMTAEEVDQGLLRTNYAMKTAEAWRHGVEWAQFNLMRKNT
jgi:hypothetical protein